MHRRTVLKGALGALGALAVLPYPVQAAMKRARTPLTVDNILHVAYPTAKREVIRAKTWATYDLEHLQRQGRVQIVSPEDYIRKMYFPQELNTRLVWSVDDDLLKEKDKISLVARMIENGMYSTDDQLIQLMGEDNNLVASKKYQYWLGDTFHVGQCRVCYLSTAFALYPTRRNV